MIKDYKFIALWLISTLLITACSNDGADGSGVTNPNEQTSEEIRLNIKNWQVMQGAPRRAQTYDGESDIKNETEGFRCFIYNGNSTTSYNSNEGSVVKWNSSTSKWEFQDGKHYWPMSGNLDFFAYMPATKPSYIKADPTYSIVESHPQASFTCENLPMTYNAATPEAGQGSSLQEFIWGITIGQNKTNQGTSGVTMKFRHPFACIKFQLAASHPNIIINSITFKGLKTGGICTLNNTAIADTYYYTTSVWSSLTPAEGGSDLVMTLASKVDDGKGNMVWVTDDVNTFNNDPSNTTPIGGWTGSAHDFVNLLVIPQTWTGQIEVNASWNDWGDTPVEHTVTATISSITWQPGYSYTYTFNITLEDLVVNLTDFTEQW